MAKTRILPPEWMPNAETEAVVVHWTGGANSVSNLDRQHYHFIIPGNCQVERGNHSIKDNENVADGDYAAHVRKFNAFKGKAVIGVSLCGMAGATESPFNKGKHPITKEQWECAALVVADLCERYDIPVDDKHVLQHGEVGEKRNKQQNGKWDICKLPWKPGLSKTAVCDEFRKMVKDAKTLRMRDKFPQITVEINGATLPVKGLLLPGRSLLPARPLLDHLKWTAKPPSQTTITIIAGKNSVSVAFENYDSEGFIPATSLALALDWPRPVYNADTLTVSVKTK